LPQSPFAAPDCQVEKPFVERQGAFGLTELHRRAEEQPIVGSGGRHVASEIDMTNRNASPHEPTGEAMD
jgi:hypothetical protein